MNDRMRVSDAEREAVTARLRDNFAEGRLTQPELDERVTAALNAKTYGDLRPLTVDLPGPSPVPSRAATSARGGQPWTGPPWGGPPWARRRHHPPMLLFLLIPLLVLLTSGGGWVVFGFFRLIMLFWLVSILVRVGFGVVGRNRRRWM